MSVLADYNERAILDWLWRGHPRYDSSHLLPKVLAGERLAIYRTVPSDVVNPTIRPGDYVTVSREYALDHAYSNLGGHLGRTSTLLEGTAYPDELEPADGPVEFFYTPRDRGRVCPRDPHTR